jgi:hypothetical protein
MEVIHHLLDNRKDIERSVEYTDDDETNGPTSIQTTTTSDDSEVAGWIQKHVAQMRGLVESGGRIRNWDPVFREIFDHPGEIDFEWKNIPGGVEASLTGTTSCGKALAEAHAKIVSEFIRRGRNEVWESHPAPRKCM